MSIMMMLKNISNTGLEVSTLLVAGFLQSWDPDRPNSPWLETQRFAAGRT
jgi:hypothetical protein